MVDSTKTRKKAEKHTILISVLAIITLVIAIIGATFAFLAARVIGNEEASSVLINTTNLTIEYKTSNEINEKNILPGFKKDLEFTIANDNNVDAGYTLNWLISLNEFANNDLVYSLDATSSKEGDSKVKVRNAPVPRASGEIGRGVVMSDSVQTYKLNIHFVDKKTNQNINQNKDFAGKIEVRGR